MPWPCRGLPEPCLVAPCALARCHLGCGEKPATGISSLDVAGDLAALPRNGCAARRMDSLLPSADRLAVVGRAPRMLASPYRVKMCIAFRECGKAFAGLPRNILGY